MTENTAYIQRNWSARQEDVVRRLWPDALDPDPVMAEINDLRPGETVKSYTSALRRAKENGIERTAEVKRELKRLARIRASADSRRLAAQRLRDRVSILPSSGWPSDLRFEDVPEHEIPVYDRVPLHHLPPETTVNTQSSAGQMADTL